MLFSLPAGPLFYRAHRAANAEANLSLTLWALIQWGYPYSGAVWEPSCQSQVSESYTATDKHPASNCNPRRWGHLFTLYS